MDSVTKNGPVDWLTKGLLQTNPQWLEIHTPSQTTHAAFESKAGHLIGKSGDLAIDVVCGNDPGQVTTFAQVTLTFSNTGTAPLSFNAKWTLPLADQTSAPRWLIPALLYKDNVQQYPGGLPSLAGEPNIQSSRSPFWVFRADLTAVPMVMAWTGNTSVAMVMEETTAGEMAGIGLDNRPGRRALVGTWPYREEPRQRDTASTGPDVTLPVIRLATLGPGKSVAVSFWLHTGDGSPHAYAPILRETFSRWDDRHPLNPWYPIRDGMDHAAHGLFEWHFDRESGALWETCSYDRYYAKNDRHVDRFEMHTGFVSGVPYAHAMRQYGVKHQRSDIAEAGRRVIDLCCSNLTPFGTFWSKYSRAEGWTSGWPSPQHASRGIDYLAAGSREIQARTIADATLFSARAAQVETHAQSRELWTGAVRSNLDFILGVMRPDGNPGEAYFAKDGSVLDWDGEAGIFWIAAMVEGYRLTSQQCYLDAAVRMGNHFAPAVEDAYLTGAPEGMHLLPTSECPQNAVVSYVLLWEATGDARWLALAHQSADLLMTFRWQYNTVFPEMTLLGKYDYRTKGMDISSPNNVHLHPYGLIAVPELVRLWEATGDTYLLKQTRNNLLGCHQMLASADGVFDARRGMMSERWLQTPNGIAKGGTLQLSHSWAIGLVLYADLWLSEYGQIFIDSEAGVAVALDAVRITDEGDHYIIENPWSRPLDLRLRFRHPKKHTTSITLAPGEKRAIRGVVQTSQVELS